MRPSWQLATLGRRPRSALGVVALLVAAALAACSPSTSTKASTTPAASPSVTAVQLAKGWTNVPSPGVAPGQHALVEHWNGSAWSVVSLAPPQNGAPNSVLNAVAALSGSNVWVAGAYYGQGPEQALIEHWNGQNWTMVPGDVSSSAFTIFSGLAAVSANDIWGVGTGAQSGVQGCGAAQGATMQHWNGARWSAVPFPNSAPDK